MSLDALSKANITKFDIYSNAEGKKVDFKGGVVELSYYEDIMSPTIRISTGVIDTGRASSDNDGTKGQITAAESIKLTGMEKCEIEMEDAVGQKLLIKDIHISSRKRITEKFNDLEILEIVSKEHLRNESVRVVERYDGKISDSIQKIIRTVLQSTKPLDIEVTQNERSFIGTTKKPFWFITWLGTQSIPQANGKVGKTAGYLFYETHKGFKFKSIDTLMSETSTSPSASGLKTKYKSYIYNNTTSSVIPVGYTGKILNYDSNYTSDMKDKLMMGVFNSSVNLFNSFESSFNCNPLNISSQESGITYAGTEYGKNLNSFFIKDVSRFFTSNELIGSLTDIGKSKEYDMEKSKILSTSTSRYNQLFTNKVNITIPADFSLEAGEMIFIDIPEQSSKPNPTYNERMSGVYMISALCHRITPGKGTDGFQAITSLELTRDSYGRKPNSTASLDAGNQEAPVGSIIQTSSTSSPSDSRGVTDRDIADALNAEVDLFESQAAAAQAEYEYAKSVEDAINLGVDPSEIEGIEPGTTASDYLGL